MAEHLPHSMNVRYGKITVRKGNYDELALYSWDAVPDCKDEMCKAHFMCDFDRRGKCTTMMQYLKGTSQMIFKNFGEVLDEPTFYRVGMHLMPMYRTLSRLKIEELGVNNIITTSDTGRKQANPIYKEIRDTIKLIDSLWHSLGLTDYVVVEVPDELDTGQSEHGTSKFLTKAGEAKLAKTRGMKRKLVRRKK